MRIAICLTICLGLPAFCLGATIWVPDNYTTIQGAIDAANNGDTVMVRAGIYTERIDFYGKAITVQSEKGFRQTSIDGTLGSEVVKFVNGEGADSVIDGFMILNGLSPLGKGGVVCVGSSPTIINNSITTNLSNVGGAGIYCENASPTIEHNGISGNMTFGGLGGAILCVNSSPSIRFNTFVGNQALAGAGVHCDVNSAPSIVNNFFANNVATYGGAIACQGTGIVITNNTIYKNTANTAGGGIVVDSGAGVTVTNTIIWDNDAVLGPQIYNAGGSLSVTYSDVMGGWTGTGNIDANPKFILPSVADVHLTWNSPCREAGNNSAPDLPAEDFDGDPRIAGTVDIGGDEFFTTLYYRGCDLVPGAPVEIVVTGIPGMAVTLFLGSGIQDPPYNTQYGLFHLIWPALWSGGIGSTQSNGALVLVKNIPLSWNVGDEKPLQALVGPWSDPLTRLTNLLILRVE